MTPQRLAAIRKFIAFVAEQNSLADDPSLIASRLLLVIHELAAAVDAQPQHLAETVAAERAACIHDVCPWCQKGEELTRDEHGNWDHWDVVRGQRHWHVGCYASEIHERMHRVAVAAALKEGK